MRSQKFIRQVRAGLAWAESVTKVSITGVPDDVYQLVYSVFDEKELVDLTIVISFRNPPQAAK
ncbi:MULTISPECIES: hypothetical protein [Acinetobacter]|uniref:hypothetical protein n=1 Tax=Acinetobacter TaxID=469 RepID=UPI002D207F1F|nr:hypothetical protein [Acinetobacter sp. IK31]MEB3863672.1 hypothetical protein [Acinetobacter sp. IK31]